MHLVFLDETSDNKNKEYLGLSCAHVSSYFYAGIKRKTQAIIQDSGWNPKIEFKGNILFSASKGDPNIDVKKRIEIAQRILALNTANKNSRIRFAYLRHKTKTPQKDYIRLLPSLLEASLPKAPKKGGGKNVLSLQFDRHDSIKVNQVKKATAGVITKKGYTLFENPVSAESNYDAVGLLYADLVGYLYGRVDNIGRDLELFEGLTPKELAGHGKFRKLGSSVRLIRGIKRLDIFDVEVQPSSN